MRSHTRTFIVLAALFTWAGLIIGISFLEAPVKFTAPGITLGLGLGIGRLVFGLMNKVEIALCAVALVALLFNGTSRKEWTLAGLLTTVLLVQTWWLLPALDLRAVAIIQGQDPGPSNLHFIYVALEFVKITLLGCTAFLVHKVTVLQKHAYRQKAHKLQQLVS